MAAESYLGILATYHDSWQFNSLLFHLLPASLLWRRLVSTCLVLAAMLVAWGNPRAGLVDLFSRYHLLMLGWCLVTPTLHPWYLTWALLSLPVVGARFRTGLYLSVAALSSYLLYWFASPAAANWLLWIELAPAYGLFCLDLRAYYHGRDEPCTSLSQNHPRRGRQ